MASDRSSPRPGEEEREAIEHRAEIERLHRKITDLKAAGVEQEAVLVELKRERRAYKKKIADLRAEVEAVEQRCEHARQRARRYRLQLEERTLLRHLLQARATARRAERPSPHALARSDEHAKFSRPYGDAIAAGCPVPDNSASTTTLGMEWWVPPDNRRHGRLADRILRGWLPLGDISHALSGVGGGIMLDIGANIGTTCLPRATLGHVHRVYAAEPEPGNFACLVRNTVVNGLAGVVFPDRVAIGDRDGTALLRISAAIGGHSVVDRSEHTTIEVPVRRLDTWLAAQSVDVTDVRFVKIDVQGYEAHVIAGAPQLLAARRAVWQLEFAPSHLREAGIDPAELIERLTRAFTHFVELKPATPGPRVHPVEELADTLGRVDTGFPEILLYHAL